MLLGESPDDQSLLTAEGSANDDLVADPDLAMGFGLLTVDVNLSVPARPLGFGPGPKEAGDVQPQVEAHS